MDDIADLVSKESDKKYFYDFRYIMGEFMAKEIGLMKQRKLENEATATSTFKLTTLLISLTMAIDFYLSRGFYSVSTIKPGISLGVKVELTGLTQNNKIETSQRCNGS